MQCIRPNLLSWEGEKWEFVGRAPSRSDFALPPDLAGLDGDLIPVRCGHCVACRVRRAKEWQIRGIHEAQSTFHPTYAVTLTYDDENLPPDGSLRKDDLRAFHRRLRYQTGYEFRFLACGEYGPNTGRAHYHGIYFGLRLPDVYRSGKLYVSRMLRDCWGMGHVSLHLAEPASIGYVSGYVVKKLRHHKGKRPVMETVDLDSGLVLCETEVDGEFLQASLRPGLGAAWADQFGEEAMARGHLIIQEKPCYVFPTYYLKRWRDLPGFPDFVARRAEKALEQPTLAPEELQMLGIHLEGELARRSRNGV